MLRARSLALASGDVEGFLRPLHPAARAVEEPIARGLLSLPLAQVDLTIDEALISDDGTTFENAEITITYRYKDLPADNPFRLVLLSDIRRDGPSLVVTRSALAESPPPPLWATGPVTLTRSEHFLAMSRPGTSRVDEALALAEEARARLVARLTLESDPKHLLVLAATSQQYASLIEGGPADASVALARFDYRQTSAYPLRPESRSLIADLEALFDRRSVPVRYENSPDVFPVVAFQHELAHLALSRFDRPSHPGWVVEGGAMLLAEERREDGWNQLIVSGLNDMSLARMGDPADMSALDYAFANAAVFYLVEDFGLATFWDFYRNFKEFVALDTPTARSSGAERLLRRYYRFGLDELDARTRAWIQAAVK